MLFNARAAIEHYQLVKVSGKAKSAAP